VRQKDWEGVDIRSFHDTVLGSGALPTDVLEEQIDKRIEAPGELAKPSPRKNKRRCRKFKSLTSKTGLA
jgi:hypothetical protein